jgi:hypothetical protein
MIWRKNSMGRISGPKTRWSLWWERFDQDTHSNALTSLRRMDREITRVYCEWRGGHPSKYPWFERVSLLVREIGLSRRTSGWPSLYSIWIEQKGLIQSWHCKRVRWPKIPSRSQKRFPEIGNSLQILCTWENHR